VLPVVALGDVALGDVVLGELLLGELLLDDPVLGELLLDAPPELAPEDALPALSDELLPVVALGLDAPLLPPAVPEAEPELCATAMPESAKSAAAVAAVMSLSFIQVLCVIWMFRNRWSCRSRCYRSRCCRRRCCLLRYPAAWRRCRPRPTLHCRSWSRSRRWNRCCRRPRRRNPT
jgi:hypothetical protein